MHLAQGLAHCFERDEGGRLTDVMVIEPVSANSLECMVAGTLDCPQPNGNIAISPAGFIYTPQASRATSAVRTSSCAAMHRAAAEELHLESFLVRNPALYARWARSHAFELDGCEPQVHAHASRR